MMDHGSHGRPTTEAQLRRLFDGHPSEFVGLTPADVGPVSSPQRLIVAAADASGIARMPRERAEALLAALRSENARLRAQITACATASATGSLEWTQASEVRVGSQISLSRWPRFRQLDSAKPVVLAQELALLSGVGSYLRSAWRLAVAYATGCVEQQAVGQQLEEAEHGVDRRATVAVTIGGENAREQQAHTAGRPELTGRLVANRYDWPAQNTVQSNSARGLASLPVELATLFERAGLPLPVSATQAGERSGVDAPAVPGAPATCSEWLYVISFSVELLSVTYSTEVKTAIAKLERAALDQTSADAVPGLVAILCDGPAADSEIIHVRALLCANDAAAVELRAERTAEMARRQEMQSLNTTGDEVEDLELFPLDRANSKGEEGAELRSAPEVHCPPSAEMQGDHFITSGAGPPWPCMPGCSCATRSTEGRTRAGQDSVSKVMLGSVTWSLPEDLNMLLQGDGALLDRIQGKFRASMALAHAWWLHPDASVMLKSDASSRPGVSADLHSSHTSAKTHDGQPFRRWMSFASTAAEAFRVSTSTTTSMNFKSARLIFNKLCAVAAAHDTLQKQVSTAVDAPEVAADSSGCRSTDGSWARRAAEHPIWGLLGLSGDELARRIRSKLLKWCGGLLGQPESLSSATFAVYSAVVRDACALASAELWVVKLECPAGSASDVSSSGQGPSFDRPGVSGSPQSYSILRRSMLGSAVQIQADLKGCTVPAWLPLTAAKEELPAPATQKAGWEAQTDWSKDASMHDSTDLWSADVPGQRAIDGR